MTPLEIVNYYANLLIIEYNGQPRAAATIRALASAAVMPQVSVQTLTFSEIASTGTFAVNGSTAINWNDSAATIQSKLQAVSGLSQVIVAGSIASQLLTITMTGVTPPAPLLVITANSLFANDVPNGQLLTEGGDYVVTEGGDRIDVVFESGNVDIAVAQVDVTLPLAIMDGCNLIGSNPAVGVQLDILGKYAGVKRSAFGFDSQITLNDADFLAFIQIAIVRNNSGSSLADIDDLLHQYFAGEILVFDFQNMRMNYLISENVGSQELVQLFITEGLLPKPMGVQLGSVIYLPSVTLVFGYRTYSTPAYNCTPYNSYANYQTSWLYLSYANAINA